VQIEPVVRCNTFVGLNASVDKPMVSPMASGRIAPPGAGDVDGQNSGGPSKAVSSDSPADEGNPDGRETLAKESELVAKASHLIDTEYDILKAEFVLGELEACFSSSNRPEAWQEFLQKDLFLRFKRKLDYFMDVGQSCFDMKGEWFRAYDDAGKNRSIHGWIDPADKRKLLYKVYAQIPTTLANVMAVANEVDLLPEWNQLVTGTPEVVGRRTAHYMVLNYQMSILGGMQKLDILNEIRRFTDTDGGFLAEYIESVPEGHPAYKPPAPGFKRPKTLLKNVWVACGPNHTVLIQSGKLELPVTVSQWWATKIGGIAGRLLIGGLVKNSLRSTEPNNPWEGLLGTDSLGLYGRLEECINSKASCHRTPKPSTPDQVEEFDLNPWFNRRYM